MILSNHRCDEHFAEEERELTTHTRAMKLEVDDPQCHHVVDSRENLYNGSIFVYTRISCIQSTVFFEPVEEGSRKLTKTRNKVRLYELFFI